MTCLPILGIYSFLSMIHKMCSALIVQVDQKKTSYTIQLSQSTCISQLLILFQPNSQINLLFN